MKQLLLFTKAHVMPFGQNKYVRADAFFLTWKQTNIEETIILGEKDEADSSR